VDRALATGEDRAAALLAIALWRRGVSARSLRGGEAGIEAEGEFGGGVVMRVTPAGLRRLLDAGVVPVVSGFQGVRGDGETITLGRGGSDISAVVVAAALGAECHIIKDVAGVYDRDPNIHPDARRFDSLGYGDLLRLAESGARVVHPAAARLAASARVPLRIYHFAAPPGAPGGTRVNAGRTRVMSVMRGAVAGPAGTAAPGARGGAA
jgi:aspartate kinase